MKNVNPFSGFQLERGNLPGGVRMIGIFRHKKGEEAMEERWLRLER